MFLALEPYGIGLGRRRPGEERDFALWLYAVDVDAAAAQLREAGAEEVCDVIVPAGSSVASVMVHAASDSRFRVAVMGAHD